LIVDTKRKPSGAITFECFQPIAGQCRQVSQARSGFQSIETCLGLPCEAREFPDPLPRSKPLSAPVPVADDHDPSNSGIYDLRK
jgi:hypothetical protein